MRKNVAVIIGAVAVVIALIASATIFLRSGEEPFRVTAYFSRAIGLFPRSTVRILGVEVGRVTSVVPDGDRVRVEMDIKEGSKIPADASAIIVPISLISDRYVQFSPIWRGGAQLRDGDTIPIERGVAPAELDDLLATLKRTLEAIEPGTAEEPGALGLFVQNAEKALADRGPELGQTVDALTTIISVLGRNVTSVDATIVNLDRLFVELSGHTDAVGAVNRGLGAVLPPLAAEQEALENGTGNLAAMIGELGSLIRDHRSDLETDLSILGDVAGVLDRQQKRLLDNILWLPVLARAGRAAFDDVGNRVLVRDSSPLIKP